MRGNFLTVLSEHFMGKDTLAEGERKRKKRRGRRNSRMRVEQGDTLLASQ